MQKYKEFLVPLSIIVGAILISVSILFAAGKWSLSSGSGNPAPAQGNKPAQGKVADIKIDSKTPYLGNPKAKVTVVEYADYQCPFCEKWYSSVMPTLKAKYIDTGKIKFVFQDFAFLGPDSNTLAEGSHCAAVQGKFWQYHDYIFTHQGQENSGWGTPDKVKAMAKNVNGLDAAQFNQCLDSGKYKQEVQNETKAGQSYGVNGTPATFVNGVFISGAQPVSVFEQAIEAALK